MEQHALCRILLLFRAVAKYYCIDPDKRAEDARTALRLQSKGTDSFFVCLLQDLDELCAFWKPDIAADAQITQDTLALVEILSVTICIENNTPEADVQNALLSLQAYTSTWNLDCLNQRQHHWLCEKIELAAPPPRLRRSIINASESAARSTRSGAEPDLDEEVLGNNDAWAVAAAVRVCEPLAKVHDSLLEQWACICEEAHSNVLASFALPCHEHNQGTVCLLNFTSETSTSMPWRIVSVFIGNDQQQDMLPGNDDLHEILLQLEQQSQYQDGRLSFNNTLNTWSVAEWQHESSTIDRPIMVSLKDWIVNQNPCPIGKVKFVDRVALAITLCYAFLELGGSRLMPYEDLELNIWLSMHNGATPHLSRPFLGTSLDPFPLEDVEDGALFWIRIANPHMPCLLALGKIILELIVGRAVPWEAVKKTMLEIEDQQPERLVCVEAIDSCIGFKDTTFKAGCIRGDERLRQEFLTRVIYKLNYMLNDGCRTSLEHIISQYSNMKDARSKTRSPQRSARPQAIAQATAHCLHDHGKLEAVDEQAARRATGYLQQLEVAHNFIEDIGPTTEVVKVAILDTGAKLGNRPKSLFGAKVKEYRTWLKPVGEQQSRAINEGEDDDGHGTHSAIAFLKASSATSEIYVAQVFDRRESSAGVQSSSTAYKENIANAILYAVNEWKVDVITMSFGLEGQDDTIHEALKVADTAGVLLIAAASNVAGDSILAKRWPAKRANVMCMYACEGGGNAYTDNPNPDEHEHNFTTLGVSVPLFTIPDATGESPVIYRSGTSISTPVAAAIAASILETMHRMQPQYIDFKLEQFARRAQQEGWTNETQLSRKRHMVEGRMTGRYRAAIQHIKTAKGMSAIFSLMAERRDGYEYVQPWKLLREHDVPITLVTKIFEALEDASLLPRIKQMY